MVRGIGKSLVKQIFKAAESTCIPREQLWRHIELAFLTVYRIGMEDQVKPKINIDI